MVNELERKLNLKKAVFLEKGTLMKPELAIPFRARENSEFQQAFAEDFMSYLERLNGKKYFIEENRISYLALEIIPEDAAGSPVSNTLNTYYTVFSFNNALLIRQEQACRESPETLSGYLSYLTNGSR